MDTLRRIRDEIVADPANAWAAELGYRPIYTAAAESKIVIVGQAPGLKAQQSGIPWHDASGTRLRSWLGITDEQFYDPDLFAILPMDFYYPGKGTSGDLPPRREVAPRWHPRILAELPRARLKILIGGYAQKYYLGATAKANLTEMVRAYHDYLPDAIPLVHPSPLNFRWQHRNPWFEANVVPALQRRVQEVLTGS